MKNTGLLRLFLLTITGSFIAHTAFADGDFDSRTGGATNWANAGYPPDFAALCQGNLTPTRQTQFDSNLTKAEQELQDGNLDKAYDALGRADSAGTRGPNRTFYSAGIKCQGESVTRRLFVAWRDYYLARKAKGQKNIPLWVVAADGGKNGLLSYTNTYAGDDYRRAVMEVRTIIELKEQERDYGAFLLAEEEAMLQACNDALPEMKIHAESKHKEALAAEERGFNYMPTAKEKALIEDGAGIGKMMGATIDSETIVMGQRVTLSQDALQDARDCNFVLFNDSLNNDDYRKWQELPSSQRARKRGDTLIAKANDASLSFTSRDRYYDMAIDYYSFGHWKQQRDKAITTKDGIQDGLVAEQQETAAKVQQMQAEMETKLQGVEDAVQSMKKTESEKKSFNAEADALEAELGF